MSNTELILLLVVIVLGTINLIQNVVISKQFNIAQFKEVVKVLKEASEKTSTKLDDLGVSFLEAGVDFVEAQQPPADTPPTDPA